MNLARCLLFTVFGFGAAASGLVGCASAPPGNAPTLASPELPVAGDDTTFLEAAQLAQRLLHNLVRIDADAIGEHGFGLVVGADEQDLYVLTARHVVVGRDGAAAADVSVHLCAAPTTSRAAPARRVERFDPGPEDLALLRTARPADYQPAIRTLSPPEHVRPGEAAWLLGRDGDCALVPVGGAIGSVVGNDVLVDLKGVRGGSSGAPLLTGRGIVALAKDSDEVIVISHAMEHARQLVVQQQAAPWTLQDARNVPPTDPAAAQVDLAETLNRYLFAVRDVHSLLLQPVVARPTFASQVATYNATVDRFRDAREKYDGTLLRHWPPAVAGQWTRLKEQLWNVHLTFFGLNTQNPQTFQTERTTPALRASMQALEPRLADLEKDIRVFLQSLSRKEP